MTDAHLRTCIRSGWPFFGVTSRGEVMARYLPYGPVFKWQHHEMIPTPLQGDDLEWWLQASGEEDDNPRD
jgi:hypothetical protein